MLSDDSYVFKTILMFLKKIERFLLNLVILQAQS